MRIERFWSRKMRMSTEFMRTGSIRATKKKKKWEKRKKNGGRSESERSVCWFRGFYLGLRRYCVYRICRAIAAITRTMRKLWRMTERERPKWEKKTVRSWKFSHRVDCSEDRFVLRHFLISIRVALSSVSFPFFLSLSILRPLRRTLTARFFSVIIDYVVFFLGFSLGRFSVRTIEPIPERICGQSATSRKVVFFSV